MGLFDALTTAVGGLQAQSFALQNISGNIANSQTTGFKETDTGFDALCRWRPRGQQTSGSVLADSVATNTVQGSIQSAAVSTNLAINGDGWFVVAKPTVVPRQPAGLQRVRQIIRAAATFRKTKAAFWSTAPATT